MGARMGIWRVKYLIHHLAPEIRVRREAIPLCEFYRAVNDLMCQLNRTRLRLITAHLGKVAPERTQGDVCVRKGIFHPQTIEIHQAVSKDYSIQRLLANNHHRSKPYLLPAGMEPALNKRVFASMLQVVTSISYRPDAGMRNRIVTSRQK